MNLYTFLQWVLSDFWRFAGMALLLVICFGGIVEIVGAFRKGD